jgi:4-hydroxybutyryl-CoA dehydratase/vinylacetyl-CoA-Delta-isomerase
MPLMNAQQYEDSLKKLNLEVYLFGERVENPVDHPMIRPSMNAVALTSQREENQPVHPYSPEH